MIWVVESKVRGHPKSSIKIDPPSTPRGPSLIAKPAEKGLIQLNEEGNVGRMDDRARALLHLYFEGLQDARNLPDIVKKWLPVDHLKSHAAEPAYLYPPLYIQGGKGQLKFRLARRTTGVVLILEERANNSLMDVLRTSGLTRREAEILSWVAEGKSNWEVSTILSISPRTVQKTFGANI